MVGVEVSGTQADKARRVFRVTMHVSVEAKSANGDTLLDPMAWSLEAFLRALESGGASVVDDALAVERVPNTRGVPAPSNVRAVLDQLLDGDITIVESDDDAPLVVEITTRHQTYRGSGSTLEVAIGAAVQEAIRSSANPDLGAGTTGSSTQPCKDGLHLWIGPVQYLDGPRLMCLHCLTTETVPVLVPEGD